MTVRCRLAWAECHSHHSNHSACRRARLYFRALSAHSSAIFLSAMSSICARCCFCFTVRTSSRVSRRYAVPCLSGVPGAGPSCPACADEFSRLYEASLKHPRAKAGDVWETARRPRPEGGKMRCRGGENPHRTIWTGHQRLNRICNVVEHVLPLALGSPVTSAQGGRATLRPPGLTVITFVGEFHERHSIAVCSAFEQHLDQRLSLAGAFRS